MEAAHWKPACIYLQESVNCRGSDTSWLQRTPVMLQIPVAVSPTPYRWCLWSLWWCDGRSGPATNRLWCLKDALALCHLLDTQYTQIGMTAAAYIYWTCVAVVMSTLGTLQARWKHACAGTLTCTSTCVYTHTHTHRQVRAHTHTHTKHTHTHTLKIHGLELLTRDVSYKTSLKVLSDLSPNQY